MNEKQLGRVWLSLSLVLAYYAVNSWVVSQGGNEIFGTKLVVSDRVPAAVVAIAVCSVLLTVTSLVGQAYARRAHKPEWHGRIPVVGFDDLSTGTKEGRLYQGAMFTLLSVLPAVSLAHFWLVMLGARIAPSRDLAATVPSPWDWAYFGLNDPARICTAYEAPTNPCAHNATFLPGLEPLAFAVVTTVSLVAFAIHVRTVFAPRVKTNHVAATPGPAATGP